MLTPELIGDRTSVLNLGAGVQSSVLLPMACRGELEEHGWPRPKVAVFADTQDEPLAVTEWLQLLRMEAHRAGIRLVTGTAGDLRQQVVDAAAGKGRYRRARTYRRDQANSPMVWTITAKGREMALSIGPVAASQGEQPS